MFPFKEAQRRLEEFAKEAERFQRALEEISQCADDELIPEEPEQLPVPEACGPRKSLPIHGIPWYTSGFQ